jgi:hypothetical protein
MSSFAMHCDGRVLVPIDDFSEAALLKRAGKDMMAKLHVPRSLKHNAWAHKLFSLVADNHPQYQTIDAVKLQLKLRMGAFDAVITPSGKTVYIPHSTDFHSMDEEAFREFMRHALRIICTELLPGIEQEDIAMEILRYAA